VELSCQSRSQAVPECALGSGRSRRRVLELCSRRSFSHLNLDERMDQVLPCSSMSPACTEYGPDGRAVRSGGFAHEDQLLMPQLGRRVKAVEFISGGTECPGQSSSSQMDGDRHLIT
jgi:hypothetical protein